MNDNTQTVARLKQQLSSLEIKKDGLINALVTQPELADDIKGSIVRVKQEINLLESEIAKAQDTDADFEEFAEFALGFVDDMKSEFWDLERVDKQRCKQLIFPGEILVARSGKVSTHELSSLFRYKKPLREELSRPITVNGGPSGARTQDTLLKRQVL